MKFKAKKTMVVEEEVEVDDRIYNQHLAVWQMANLILDGCLDSITNDLYHDQGHVVKDAAERINAAFIKADQAIAMIKNGEYET